jgi:hypothetical protein
MICEHAQLEFDVVCIRCQVLCGWCVQQGRVAVINFESVIYGLIEIYYIITFTSVINPYNFSTVCKDTRKWYTRKAECRCFK